MILNFGLIFDHVAASWPSGLPEEAQDPEHHSTGKWEGGTISRVGRGGRGTRDINPP